MKGINAKTGKYIQGIDHLRQSIRDVLTTPVGTRVMRREYGSRLYQLVDAPINAGTLLDIYAATAEALDRWEPRFSLENVRASYASAGNVTITLSGEYRPDGEKITLDGIEVT